MKAHLGIKQRREFDHLYDQFILKAGFFEQGDYYQVSRERYWETFRYLAGMGVPPGTQLLEVGGGQLAVLGSKLLGHEARVADVSEDFSESVRRAGLPFSVCNLLEDDPAEFNGRFDVIALLEVIEHIPQPGYVVLSKLARWLKPGGSIILTTPNLFRLRNLVRLVRGRDLFDRFEYPAPGRGLGHQLEYSADHLRWQIERAGLHVRLLEHDQLGQSGHSRFARTARRLTAPLRLRPKWREGLVAVACKPAH